VNTQDGLAKCPQNRLESKEFLPENIHRAASNRGGPAASNTLRVIRQGGHTIEESEMRLRKRIVCWNMPIKTQQGMIRDARSHVGKGRVHINLEPINITNNSINTRVYSTISVFIRPGVVVPYTVHFREACVVHKRNQVTIFGFMYNFTTYPINSFENIVEIPHQAPGAVEGVVDVLQRFPQFPSMIK
jgi:hypothetical protein